GSFQMTMSEVATAQMNKAYVITFILNNYYLGMVRQWQELFYGKRFFSALTSGDGKADEKTEPVPGKTPYIPDFVKYAEAQGAIGFRIWNNKELDENIDKIFEAANKSNVIVDVIVDPTEKVFPMVPAGAGLDEIIIDMA
ncbi:MAG: thiamine pyrophosphate-dependent enzyme, partial [bacterium]|nr:thiamine pyrophosphate-dependent enzyme [bacterium]